MLFCDGYDADYFHKTVESVFRITPTVSSGVDHEEVYLLRSEKALYMGYADDNKISSLYELRLNESLPTHLYTLRYTSSDVMGGAITLDTKTGKGSITFSPISSYFAIGSYIYENSRVIFTTDDSYNLKLVFLDVGNALIFSQKESNTTAFDDGAVFYGYYQLYGSSSATTYFDINKDGIYEMIFVGIGDSDTLQYIIHSMGTTIANKTIPFTKYDEVHFDIKDGLLYLIGEYSDADFKSYYYKISFDGENLIFTPEE